METMTFYVSCFEPFVEYPFFHWNMGYQPFMRDLVEAGANIAFEYPFCSVISTQCNETGFNGIWCRTGRSKSVGVGVSRCFGNRVESKQVQGLHCPIPHRRNR